MENYSIYIDRENQKYTFLDIARAAGAKITDVSGCGAGYHISILATPNQAKKINNAWGAVA